MSKLDDLIKEYCPEGVEYVELSEVCSGNYGKGNKIPENGGIYPVYGCNGVVGNTSTYNNENTPIVGHIGTAGIVVWGENKHYVTYNGTICKPKVNNLLSKYLYYFLLSAKLTNYVKGSQPFLSYSDFNKIKIPLPPIQVQEEIVRILDSFTELTAELTAELRARKKQYEYYRDTLLTFDDSCEFGMLSDVLKIKNGKDYKRYSTGNVPVYGSGGLMTYIDTFVYDKPSVLIPRKGSLDKLYYISEPFWTVDTIFYTEININIVIPKFVFYFLKKEHLEQYNTAGGVPSLTQSVLNKIAFPIPTLEEQQRIVDILDRFDALCNDISKGLPAEIENRKKQYEYYRDKLLTFKVKEE